MLNVAAPTAAEIRAFRKRHELTREAFAKRLGVSSSIVFLWESGKRQPRQARSIAALRRVLDTSQEASTRTRGRVPQPARGSLGRQIRAVRERLKLSQKAFAKRVGVSTSIVYMWESGRSTPTRRAILDRLRRVGVTA